jgi:hypothetical protein
MARARARRRLPRLPSCHLTSHLKFDRTTGEHQLIMLNPILAPLLPINPHALHEVTTSFIVEPIRHDTECIVVVDSDFDIVEPRRADKEDWLSNNRIEPELLLDEPRIECAGVWILGQSVGSIVEAIEQVSMTEAKVPIVMVPQTDYWLARSRERWTDLACLFK